MTMLSTPDAPNAVNTIEDVIRLLRERPDVRDAVRREILTDELLEMPAKIAQILEIQEKHGEKLEKFGEVQEKHGERLDNVETVQQQILDRLDGQDEILEKHGEILDRHTREIAQLRIDVSRLNGRAAMEVAKERYELIAMEMGLEEPRMLSLVEIAKMAMSEAASEYTEGELNSFRDCDIIIAATSAGADESYAAVQVSTTVDHDDIRRAIDHARMVTRFTGRPARAAVAGFSASRVAERRLAGGSVHWHRMPQKAMNPR